MSKVKFRIGGSPGVMFNLPSKKAGEPSVCVGKVVIDIYGLKCSEALSFNKSSLIKLSKGARKLFESLKGEIHISSTCESFHLKLSGGSTGNIKVEVTMKKSEFTQPYEADWRAGGSFYGNPECLLQLIEAYDAIRS